MPIDQHAVLHILGKTQFTSGAIGGSEHHRVMDRKTVALGEFEPAQVEQMVKRNNSRISWRF
ncbi:MAG: hypothetical protein ACOH2J_03520 [Allorhizobium sp.]